jgi:hypothetical protein
LLFAIFVAVNQYSLVGKVFAIILIQFFEECILVK